jgi:hypothetical protein
VDDVWPPADHKSTSSPAAEYRNGSFKASSSV